MKNRLIKFLVVLMLLQVIVLGTVPLKAATTYTASWDSVNTHPPSPEWFQDAKFGLWYHWGAYSVPAFGSEWYPRNMYLNGSWEYNHHTSVFGDPYSNWPYHNFLNGAYNKAGVYTKFAPKLKSQGGNFDPDEWAQLFVDAGAKMAGPVAEHHDGFSLWNSTCNEWNSVNKGPGLDLTGLFANAYRAKGLKFLVSTHTAFNFTGYYQGVPAQSDSSLKKLYGQLSQAEEEQLWLNKEKELIDLYQPDYMWHDFNMGYISEATRLQYLAYYYNKAIDWGKEVVVSYNDGFNTNGEVQQVERGGYSNTTYPFWLCEDSVSSSTWSYTEGMGYYSGKAVLHSLIDRVSKNGCLLLDICPMADGTIPQAQKDILLTMGNWLKVYGEAIYATRAWDKYGEGPTQLGTGGFSTPVEATSQDIRFTRNKANNVLYAIGLGWPSNNQMVITSLKTPDFNTSTITGITIINGGGSCSWSQDSTGLKVNLPSNLANNTGCAVKISFSGAIPRLSKVTFYQDYNYAGNAVSLGPGNYTLSQLNAAGISDNSVSSVKAPNGMQVEVYDGDNFSGTKWTFTADNANFGSVGCNDAMSSVKIIDNSPPSTPTPTPTLGPRSAFSQIEAESYNSQSGIQSESCAEGGQNIGYIENGDYIVYNNIDLGAGATDFQARVASATSGGSIEIRLDGITGTLLGTCSVAGTGGWQTWTTSSCSVSSVSGIHNLYLKFTGGSGYLFNINWFQFIGSVNTPTPTATPTPTPTITPFPTHGWSAYSQIEAESYDTQSGIQTESCAEGGQNIGYIENGDYVVYNNLDFGAGATDFQARVASATSGGNIEIRIDSLTGTVVGTCSVTGTGGWQNWITSSCSVSGASGTHNLYLKFTGGSGYLFNVNWFKFTSGSATPTPSATTTPTVTPTPGNLITNPGLETGNTTGWAVNGAGTITVSTVQKYSGAYSLLHTGRTATWNGLLQNLTSKVQSGKTYACSGWVRLDNATSGTVIMTIKKTDGSGTSYTNIATGTGSNSSWIQLSGNYSLTVSGTLTELSIYFEGPASGVNYYLDDVSAQ